jgi:hypothetical protein
MDAFIFQRLMGVFHLENWQIDEILTYPAIVRLIRRTEENYGKNGRY